MAKGDREILKADIDDGYTKIADLLLEALAMAKLNGVQKGICLFLWRRTYGWKQKEDQITLKEFALACDTSESYISRQLKQLVDWNIIIRTSYNPGKAAVYTFNTRVTEWYKGCINVQGLSECAIQGLYKCTIQGFNICEIQGFNKCERVNQYSDQETQGFEGSLYTDYKQYKDNSSSCSSIRAHAREDECKKIQECLESAGVLTPSPIEIESLLAWLEKGIELGVVLLAIQKAALAGSRQVRYINGTLRNWYRDGIRTMSQVEAYEIEFEQRKLRDGPKGGQARGFDSRNFNDSRAGPKAGYRPSEVDWANEPSTL